MHDKVVLNTELVSTVFGKCKLVLRNFYRHCVSRYKVFKILLHTDGVCNNCETIVNCNCEWDVFHRNGFSSDLQLNVKLVNSHIQDVIHDPNLRSVCLGVVKWNIGQRKCAIKGWVAQSSLYRSTILSNLFCNRHLIFNYSKWLEDCSTLNVSYHVFNNNFIK